MDEVIFYREWLPLPKAEFNVLAMIAEQGGSFSGNYTDICRYLGVTCQSRNRNALRAAIEELTQNQFITQKSRGRTLTLTVIPKATEVRLPRLWVRLVIHRDYSSEAVAFANVLKVFIWIADNDLRVVTNRMIARELNVSVSTVVSAKNVLEHEYENITKRKVSEKVGENFFRTLGQELAAGAWWTEL